MYVSDLILYLPYAVNFMVIFRTIAKIPQIYRWGILIWATCDLVHRVQKKRSH